MAKIISVDAYDILTKATEKRHINVDNVIEIEELSSYDNKPLSRIKMSDGSFIDVQKNIDDVTKIINQ